MMNTRRSSSFRQLERLERQLRIKLREYLESCSVEYLTEPAVFGKVLDTTSNYCGITIEEVASWLGILPTTISHYIRDGSKCSLRLREIRIKIIIKKLGETPNNVIPFRGP